MNTLFARTVLLSVAMLLAVHVGYRLIESVSLPGDDFSSSALQAGAPYLAIHDARASGSHADDDDTPGIGPALSIRPRLVDLGTPVAPSLRAAVWSAAPMSMPISMPMSALALADKASPDSWDDAPFAFAFDARFAPLILSLPAALIALCAYWFCQTRRNLRELAQLARNVDRSGAALHAPDGAHHNGVCDVRLLARTLTDLMGRHHRALDEQSTALAAFSRQIDARVARLRTRALGVAQWHKRVGFIEDIDLFTNVARQFVDIVGRSETQAAPVGVDVWLRDRFVHGASLDDAKIVLRLNAGDGFALPRNALERLVGNLVGNALAHGAPPIEICTTCGVRTWMLSVRDHGKGIGESDLAAAMQPFVRLASHEPHGDTRGELTGHWGLGLSIVSRLAEHCGAKLKLGNHPEGGLWVRVIVPRHKASMH